MAAKSGNKTKLGKILLKQKLVSQEELEKLLERQKAHPGQRLASVAVKTGNVREEELLRALHEQHGVPGIDLKGVVVPLSNLKLIPEEIAKQHTILPVLVKESEIMLAMADPGDRRVIDEIEFVTGRRVFPYVALHDTLKQVIAQAYELGARGEAYFIGPNIPPDYLESLGLGSSDSVPPDPRRAGPGGGVVAQESPEPSDDLGIEELIARSEQQGLGPSLDTDEAPLPPMNRARPRVLVVDDEDDIRRLLKRVLTEKGYDVNEAARGVEALQLVRSQPPDLILLDAMLPEVHGFDICRRIKGSQRYGHIPIIMVSAIYRGWRFAEDLKQSYGVATFLEKPFKIGEVLSAVERGLKGRQDEESPAAADDDLSREANESLSRGIEAYQEGDLDRAIAELQRGIRIDPLSFKLHYHLGLLFGRRDDLFEAIHELETAVDLQGKNFSALKNLAVLYQRAGFKHKAVEMWERALGNAPDDETKRGIKDHLMSLL